jgi:hypothetical protein
MFYSNNLVIEDINKILRSISVTLPGQQNITSDSFRIG